MSLDESPERDVEIKDETLTRLNLVYEKPTDQHLKNFPKDKMINLLRRDNVIVIVPTRFGKRCL